MQYLFRSIIGYVLFESDLVFYSTTRISGVITFFHDSFAFNFGFGPDAEFLCFSVFSPTRVSGFISLLNFIVIFPFNFGLRFDPELLRFRFFPNDLLASVNRSLPGLCGCTHFVFIFARHFSF